MKLSPLDKVGWETELQCCKIFGHPMRQFLDDVPYYYDMKLEPLVNFNLNYQGLH